MSFVLRAAIVNVIWTQYQSIWQSISLKIFSLATGSNINMTRHLIISALSFKPYS
jgi:hypothetical protein